MMISFEIIFTLVVILLYILYYKKFKFYIIADKLEENLKNKLRRGKCPPSYPNGWYRLCRSNEIQQAQVKNIKLCGRNIAYYRGTDNIVYAVHAYCPHMGANLGVGGKVKHTKCIECPFHGWTFEGGTGLCVNSSALDPKPVNQYQYVDVDQVVAKDGAYLEPVQHGPVNIKTYLLKEVRGIVFIWIHSMEKQPWYDPIAEESEHLVLRAESINHVNCHIQEIPENGADIRHFDFIHKTASDFIPTWLVELKWEMKTMNASNKDFFNYMVHPVEKCRKYQKNLFDQYFAKKELIPYMNVLILDGYMILFKKWRIHMVWATGFQMGPATVNLYVKNDFFELLFKQAIQPVEKFTLKVYHTLWSSSGLPYWLSAYLLYAELRQVLLDGTLWNHKIFSDKLHYNLKLESDQALYNWRNWYSQFYEGCHNYESKLDQLEW